MMSGLTMLTLCYERAIVYKCMVMFSILASQNFTFMQVSLGRVAPPSTTVKTCIRVSCTVIHNIYIYTFVYLYILWVLVKIGVHDWMVNSVNTVNRPLYGYRSGYRCGLMHLRLPASRAALHGSNFIGCIIKSVPWLSKLAVQKNMPTCQLNCWDMFCEFFFTSNIICYRYITLRNSHSCWTRRALEMT